MTAQTRFPAWSCWRTVATYHIIMGKFIKALCIKVLHGDRRQGHIKVYAEACTE